MKEKEKQVYFFALQKEVTAQEFIDSVPEPCGSIDLAQLFQAIKDKKIEVLN
jgi:hypothetical protein